MPAERLSTCSWPETLDFYQRLVARDGGQSLAPMLELVRSIASSPHAGGLFPVPSCAILQIGRVRDFVAGEGEIRIAFDRGAQAFEFLFTQRPGDPSPWSRTCAAAEGRQTFERLLHKRLRWFHEG
jgi:hypothetical protein